MTFKACKRAFPPSTFLKLDHDEATAVVVFVGEPEPREGTYKGKPRVQSLFPVLDDYGLHVWSVGVTQFQIIEDNWIKLSKAACRIIRKGAKGDQGTTYDLEPVQVPTLAAEQLKTMNKDSLLELWERVAKTEEEPKEEGQSGPSDAEAASADVGPSGT